MKGILIGSYSSNAEVNNHSILLQKKFSLFNDIYSASLNMPSKMLRLNIIFAALIHWNRTFPKSYFFSKFTFF